jgi:hypothetical protein
MNERVINNSMALALLKHKVAVKKCGYRLQPKKAAWPRVKGPVGTRVDVSTGLPVSISSRMQ